MGTAWQVTIPGSFVASFRRRVWALRVQVAMTCLALQLGRWPTGGHELIIGLQFRRVVRNFGTDLATRCCSTGKTKQM